MKKLRKSLGNEGFTLVELIIVIAIIAVLVAILAPQYIKYVEKSRQASDISAADSILSACKTAAIDPEVYDFSNGGFTATWSKDGPITVTPVNEDTSGKLQSAVQAIVGSSVTPKSKACKENNTTFTYESSTNTFSVAGGAVTAGGSWS